MKRIFLICLSVFMLACGEEKGPSQTATDGTVSEADAKRLYQMKCAICHGVDGKLMIGGSPDLSISTKTIEERIALITYGKTTMPPQKDILTTAEIVALALYVDNFKN